MREKVLYVFGNVPVTYSQIAKILGRKKSGVQYSICADFKGDIESFLVAKGFENGMNLIDALKQHGIVVGELDETCDEEELTDAAEPEEDEAEEVKEAFDDDVEKVMRCIFSDREKVKEEIVKQDAVKVERVDPDTAKRWDAGSKLTILNSAIGTLTDMMNAFPDAESEVRISLEDTLSKIRLLRISRFADMIDWNQLAIELSGI